MVSFNYMKSFTINEQQILSTQCISSPYNINESENSNCPTSWRIFSRLSLAGSLQIQQHLFYKRVAC